MKKLILFLSVFCVISSFVNASEPKPYVEYFSTPKPIQLPFSDAVRVGNLLYLSGEIGIDHATMKLVPGGIREETRQIMESIQETLERHGSSMNKVIKCTVMLADINEWKDFNEVYVNYFDTARLPARAGFGVSGLAFGARVEVECVAYIGEEE